MAISQASKIAKIEELCNTPSVINAGFIAFADLLNITVEEAKALVLKSESAMDNFHKFVTATAIAIVCDKCAEIEGTA